MAVAPAWRNSRDALAGKYRVIRLEPHGTGTSKDVASLMVQAVREINERKDHADCGLRFRERSHLARAGGDTKWWKPWC